MSQLSAEQSRQYWRRCRRLMARLLALWALVSFGFGILWVEPLNQIRLGGFKLGFWFAQQGAIYVFVGIIFYYVRAMRRLDAEFGLDEDPQ